MKFGHRIKTEEAVCLLHRIELADHFFDYKLLKKKIKPLTEDEGGEEAETVFRAELVSQMRKVDDFFRVKEEEYWHEFESAISPRVIQVGSSMRWSPLEAHQSENEICAALEEGGVLGLVRKLEDLETATADQQPSKGNKRGRREREEKEREEREREERGKERERAGAGGEEKKEKTGDTLCCYGYALRYAVLG